MKYSFDQQNFMKRCFELAENGLGKVAPNPMVGAVIVYKGKIIGEGFHEFFGGPHAEVNAINSVAKSGLKYLASSEMYVNLEPCSHFGKTPPCADLIIVKGIKKIFIANQDPNPLVAGKGIEKLRKAGCKVNLGLLEEEGEFLNRRFFIFHQHHRPYLILKWAQSDDGYFTKNPKKQHWITGGIARRLVHKWRSEEAAIMVGTNTAKTDNPQLTNRYWNDGKNPVRIVLDKDLTLPTTLNIFDGSSPTFIITSKKVKDTKKVKYLQIKFDNNLIENLLKELYKINLQSLMVEGGAELLNSFIENKLWHEGRIFTGKVRFGSGVESPKLKGKLISEEQIGEDVLQVFINGR